MSLPLSSSSNGGIAEHFPFHAEQHTKDTTYYFDDGDCILLVENTYFKLHKAFLCRDPSSMFCSMFKDAKGHGTDVIPLSDTVEEFRALCWILYALPDEIYSLATRPRDVDVRKHLRIIHMVNKYVLPRFESWACTVLQAIPSALRTYLDTCGDDDLENAMNLAMCYQVDDNGAANSTTSQGPLHGLLKMVEDTWLKRLTGSGPPNSPSQIDYRRALRVGENYGRRQFQGKIYLHLRKRLTTEQLITSDNSDLQAHLGLDDAQFGRFLRGSALLLGACVPHPSSILPADAMADPHYHGGCQAFWNGLQWTKMYQDPLAFLEILRRNSCAAAYFGTYPTADDIVNFFLEPVKT